MPDKEHRFYGPGEYQGLSSVSVPIRTRKYCFFALGLSCGQRRAGDVQWQLEFAVAKPTVEIVILSVDIAIGPIGGDLTRGATMLEWIEHIRCLR
eukprot:7054838-Pyramimonas_sp.AAC.1